MTLSRSAIRFGTAAFVGVSVLVAGVFSTHSFRQPSANRAKPATTSSNRMAELFGGIAAADFCLEQDLVREEFFASGYPQPNENNTCGPPTQGWAEAQGSMKTYCDGEVVISPPSSGGFCNFPDGITCSVTTKWIMDCNNQGGGQACANSCIVEPPEMLTGVECETLCLPKPPCCKKDDCSDCVIEPLSLPGLELSYTLPVFETSGAGFPLSFDIFWRGRSIARLSPTGPIMGPRAAHSLAFYFYKGVDSGGFAVAHVASEGGDVAAFKWNETASAWEPQEGRRSSLQADPPGVSGCSGEATFTEEDGSIVRFNEYCDGDPITEGTVITVGPNHGLTRPNGDFIDFTVNARGQISTATNRRGEAISFAYESAERPGTAAWGRIHTITSPSGLVYRLDFERGVLRSIARVVGPGSEAVWTLEADPMYPNNASLKRVRDARGKIDKEWTYVGAAGTVLDSEAGPDLDPTGGENTSANAITISTPNPAGEIGLTFTPAGSASPVTNTYKVSPVTGALSHVTERTLNGNCPNCGGSNEARSFWDGTNWVYAKRDGNGSITVFRDPQNVLDKNAAYTPGGMPKFVLEGCTGSVASPVCSSPRTTAFTYLPGTRVVQTSTRSSVIAGQVVTTTRTFDGSSTRVLVESTTGRTASTLNGQADTQVTRSTRYTYGGGAGGLEITAIEGPYEGGAPTSSDPRIEFAYYTNQADACESGTGNPNNLNRLMSVRKWVSPTRFLETKYCQYGFDGRAHVIEFPNALETSVEASISYNWRGQVTQLSYTGLGSTAFAYDANGNLIEIQRPIVDSKRLGTRYSYDDADRLIRIEQGHFVDTTFTSARAVDYTYDAWGNRTKTEFSTAGTIEISESSKFDAYNRLSELARPAGSTTNRSRYSYDPNGNLTRVGDHQGDDVFYGSGSPFIEAYDSLGKVRRVKQEICTHVDPNDVCTPAEQITEYDYDAGLNLEEVRVADGVRGGVITTRYTYDDFGSVVGMNRPDDGGDTWYLYDASGRLVESQDDRQRGAISPYKIKHAYDRLGRLTETRKAILRYPFGEPRS